MSKKPNPKEYLFEGQKAIHIPTNTPIWLPYPGESVLPRTVKHLRREMVNYNETFVVGMGAQLLIEKGF